MNCTPSPEPVDSVIISPGPFQNNSFDGPDANEDSINNGNIQKYSRSALYLLRNDTRSRKRPECALRTELQSLGVWKFHSGNGHQNGNNAANNEGATSSNPQPLSSNINSRSQRSPSTRGISSGDHSATSAVSTSTSSHSLHHHNPIQKTFIDHRSISSSHLMPAFAKRRIAATSTPQHIGTAGNFTTYGGNVSEPRPETPTDVKDIPTYAGRHRSKEPLHDYRQRGDEQPNYLSPHRKSICEPERERNSEHDRSGSASSPVSAANSRHSHQTNMERRIGSGRLLPRDVNWDFHRGQDKDKISGSLPADKELPASNHNLQGRNTGRYAERTHDRSSGGFIERRSFERKGVSGTDDNMRDKFENTNSSNTTRRFASNEIITNVESSSNHHQQQPPLHGRNRRNHQYNDRNEEPEWFSGGPTSQHDTIELRGFEEIDEHHSGGGGINKRTSSRKLRENASSSRASSGIGLNSQTPVQSKDQPLSNTNVSTAKIVDCNTDVTKAAICDETNSTLHIDKHVTIDENTNYDRSGNNNTIDKSTNDFEIPEKDQNSDNVSLKNATEFNFDVFLNLDPLDHTFMRSDSHIGTDTSLVGSSRFSRWFASKTSGDDSQVPDETDLQRIDDSSQQNQSNTLMEFLHGSKLPFLPDGLQHTHGAAVIPSVEELEARMRKVDTNDALNETSKIKGHETTSISSSEGYIQQQHKSLSQQPSQDMEAFKKLLEQLGSGNKQPPTAMQLLVQQANRSPTNPQMNMMPPSSIVPTGIHQPPLLPHMLKNEEIKKFIQQQQLVQQQQHQRQIQIQPVVSHSNLLQQQQLSPKIPQRGGNEVPIMPSPSLFFGQPHKRMETQHLFQCVARGEISLSFLEQELNNTNTSQHAKEIIAAVLRENSRSVTPSSGLSGSVVPSQPLALNKQDILSPIPMLKTVVISESIDQQRSQPQQGLPSPRDLQFHTQAILQNAMLKKKLDDQQQHEALRRRQEMRKQQSGVIMPGSNEIDSSQKNLQQLQISTGIVPMQSSQHQQPGPQQSHAPQQTRLVNSPTPLAFTPTSVLRKMTADKDNLNSQQQSASSAQQHATQNKPLAQTLFVNQHPHQQQVLQQAPPPQPRMILGGNHQQQHQQLSNGGPQLSPQSVSQQPLQQMRGASQVKWPAHIINQNMPVNKPMGRPILKGPLPPVTLSQQQQTLQQIPQMTFASKLEFQQIQQQRLKNNQTPQHMLNQQQQTVQAFSHPMQQQQPQSQTNILAVHAQQQQQLFQHHQQRALALQRQQQQLQIQQQFHQHQPQQLDAANRLLGIPSASGSSSLATNNAASIINYQRDGGLSPTSNQLAQWFSPELLAQASAGKLPLLNMNQALSLEEFERSIQHSSAAVHN